MESTNIEETQVFGAIGPLPDVGKKTIVDVVSISILIMGNGRTCVSRNS